MRFSTSIVALALASIAVAQSECVASVKALPSCGATCIASVASGLGCALGDYECQCEPDKVKAIQAGAINCVVSACGAVTALQVQNSALAICSCASVHPSTVAASTTSSSSGASLSATTAASTTSGSSASSAAITSSSSSKSTITSAPGSSSVSAATTSLSSAGAQGMVQVGAGAGILAGFGGLLALI